MRKAPQTARLRRYLLVLFGLFALSGLFWGLNYGVLYLTGETARPSEAAARQKIAEERYGSRLRYKPLPYKLAILEREKPAIVAVGSSRAMMFRREYFLQPFVSLSGAANDPESTLWAVQQMLKRQTPELVLLTVDYWWFNPARDVEFVPTDRDDSASLSLLDLLKPTAWLFNGELQWRQLGRLIASRGESPPGIGLSAKTVRAGFDAAGTYHYGDVLTRLGKSDDEKFRTSLRRVSRAGAKYNPNFTPSEAAARQLGAAISLLRERGVKVMVILPPLAPSVFETLKKEDRQRLLAKIGGLLAQNGAPLFDFSDPTPIASPDCEFIDGVHGGAVTYARMLLLMLQHEPKLDEYLDRQNLNGMVKARSGYATLPQDHPRGMEEIDYLKLGCAKS